MNGRITRRAGPLFGLWLLVVGMVLAVSPVIPRASAVDPTPTPSDGLPTTAPVADPAADPTPTPPVDPAPTATPPADPVADPTPTPAPTADPSPTPAPRPGVKVTHYWVDELSDIGVLVSGGTMDDPRIGMQRFTVYTLRFQLVNDGATDAIVTPELLVSEGLDGASWALVPDSDGSNGKPFYVAADKGYGWQERTTLLAVSGLRLATATEGTSPVPGRFSGGINPIAGLSLPAGTFTEVVFQVRATADAPWATPFQFRLNAGGATVTGHADAVVAMRAKPATSQGEGTRAEDRPKADAQAFSFPLVAPSRGTGVQLASAVAPSWNGPTLTAGAYVSPHANYSLTTDACAACHVTHTGQGRNLLQASQTPISTLCFVCHDGSGATANTLAQWAAAPANVPASNVYYSHPSLETSTYMNAQADEFHNVSNRRAECVDCHQPHNSTGTTATQTANGWTAGGAIAGATGVGVTNTNPSDPTAITYTWKQTITYEYELCYKCHSGYTTLKSNSGIPLSQQMLDKAIEFNPYNVSFHPVEAVGKNQTSWMDLGLSEASTGRVFTGLSSDSTIRCDQCHGSSSTTPADSGASQIDNHASVNAGILLRNYQSQTLNGRTEFYTAADFSLCYMCHARQPFEDASGDFRDDTNFFDHGFHTVSLRQRGTDTGTDINTDGAGSGNAVCAECHFRIHGSGNSGNTGTTVNQRLVNFAPDVQPANGSITFVQQVGTANGSCTLTCHGYPHVGKEY